MTDQDLEKFIGDQLSVWPLAAENYRDLKKARVKNLNLGGVKVRVQLNPGRKISSDAALDPASIAARPCFLCPENRPAEQYHVEFEGRKGRKYRITLNPFPIFPHHLVISSARHTTQSIWHRFQDMLDFTRSCRSFLCFYNGPRSGASAPDHMHFQACPKELMPLATHVEGLLGRNPSGELEYLANVKEAQLFHLKGYAKGVFVLHASTPKSMAKLFYRLLDCASVKEGDSEPRINILSWFSEGEYRTVVIFREKHRPHNYFSQGPDHLAMSPGCADMGGVFITTSEEDFGKLGPGLLEGVVDEVCISGEEEGEIIWRLTRDQEKLEVGIMSGQDIDFEIISDGAGRQRVSYKDGRISYNGVLYDELYFEAVTESTMFAEPSFILYGVTIGVGFHWERQVDQKFAGTLKFIAAEGKVWAVNIIGVEDYLLSVISSEMKASAGLEFLKAHAVISRSWVMSRIAQRGKHQAAPEETLPEEGEEYVKWFDQQDHAFFDVCADDHCQRYQGLTMAVGDTVRKAVDQTWGLVLKYGDELCDARFSKCCGGRMELFSTCWEEKDPPYLKPLPDTPSWAEGEDPFCNTSDESVLSQVLNDYDLETKDFYRWKVEYSRKDLSELVRRRSGIDFGTIDDLVPVEKGPSGRIKRLLVRGDKKSLVIGKELIIRKWLSESHLKSSAFEAKWDGDRVVLQGSGWGHGVGLCQIGAAVMGSKGYTFDAILSHYYPGSELGPLNIQHTDER